jgi:hypothetical protein
VFGVCCALTWQHVTGGGGDEQQVLKAAGGFGVEVSGLGCLVWCALTWQHVTVGVHEKVSWRNSCWNVGVSGVGVYRCVQVYFCCASMLMIWRCSCRVTCSVGVSGPGA